MGLFSRRARLPKPKEACSLCGKSIPVSQALAHKHRHIELLDGNLPAESDDGWGYRDAPHGCVTTFLLRSECSDEDLDRLAEATARFIARCLTQVLPDFPKHATFNIIPLRYACGKALYMALLVVRY